MINLEMFLKRLYRGFNQDVEVMSLIGFLTIGDDVVVEMVKYYTSFEEDAVLASFKEIVQDMVTYGLMARGEAEFVLVHNHPQGTERASMNDRKMKERLSMVSEFLGVRFLGSYIYVEGALDLVYVPGVTEVNEPRFNMLLPDKNVVQNNLYLDNGEFRYPEMDILVEYREYEEEKTKKDWYQKQLNNAVLDKEFIEDDGSKLGLVILDKENKILNLIDADTLVDEEVFIGSTQMCMSKEKVSFFLEEGQTNLLYDTRTDLDLEDLGVRRSEEGIAEDVLLLTKMMGIMMYPIDYYMR